ncbi:unnamed protein product [Absidia cylindrospora]
MSDQPYNTQYTHQQYQQRPFWHQHNKRGGFRGSTRGGVRGNTRGFSRGRGRGRGGHKQTFTSDRLEFDKTSSLEYSPEILEQHFEPYYSPLFSQDPWTTSPS